MEHVDPQELVRRQQMAAPRAWIAVAAVGLSTFSVVTTEMLPVGLLTPIAETLHASVGTAGLTMSVPAILAAFFAPSVILASGGIDRRRVLCGLLALLVVANLASAFSPSIIWLLVARVIVGFCIGGIWAIAGGLASRIVPAGSVGLATAIIFGGVAAASVLGIPFGAMIGDLAGWRVAFGAMAILSALVLLLNLWFLPALPVDGSATFGRFVAQAKNRRVQLGLAITLFLVAGHFMAFTFVRPLLQSISGFDVKWIGLLLFTYGTAGIVGNFLAGVVATRHVGWTLVSIALGLSVTILVFRFVGSSGSGGAAMMVLWGVVYGSVSVTLQTWMLKAAPAAVEVATSLLVATFNAGIAFGAFVGGQIVDGFDLRTNMLVAGSLPVVALVLAGAIQRDIARSRTGSRAPL